MTAKKLLQSTTLGAAALAILVGVGATANAATITIGFGQDKPPFVNEKCTDGIEVRLAYEMFKRAGFETKVHCLTNKRMIDSYIKGKIDAGVTVPNDQPGMYYTSAFSGYKNFAISRKEDGLEIDSIADLADKSVVAWNNAAGVLGEEFKEAMENTPKYIETTSQTNQVKIFLAGRTQIIIIDKTIFRWLTKILIESGEFDVAGMEFTYHPIFPGTLDYYVGLSNKDYRDRVEAALTEMREDGTYTEILNNYLSY